MTEALTQTHTSALYLGQVRHRRFGPRRDHQFRYPLYMVWVDLARLDSLQQLPGLQLEGFGWLSWRRRYYLGDPALTLDEAVRQEVQQRLGIRPDGPVMQLAQLGCLGIYFSPINLYYCYQSNGQLLAVLCEVRNTPWHQRHLYCLDMRQPLPIRQNKEFHVSPFMPMQMQYRFWLKAPGTGLGLHIENHAGGAKRFDATLSLRRRALSRRTGWRLLLRFPWMGLSILRRIYWQALILFLLKGAPFYGHSRPSTKETHS